MDGPFERTSSVFRKVAAAQDSLLREVFGRRPCNLAAEIQLPGNQRQASSEESAERRHRELLGAIQDLSKPQPPAPAKPVGRPALADTRQDRWLKALVAFAVDRAKADGEDPESVLKREVWTLSRGQLVEQLQQLPKKYRPDKKLPPSKIDALHTDAKGQRTGSELYSKWGDYRQRPKPEGRPRKKLPPGGMPVVEVMEELGEGFDIDGRPSRQQPGEDPRARAAISKADELLALDRPLTDEERQLLEAELSR